MKVRIRDRQVTKDVTSPQRFETLQDGDWFLFRGILGVKVDARGFYPATNMGFYRGLGAADVFVTKVNRVTIEYA